MAIQLLLSLYPFGYLEVLAFSKKPIKIRLQQTNGELHFIFKESSTSIEQNEEIYYDQIEAIHVSKLEAAKPLHLIRH